ncbi:MAG TPA: amidohydrolase [Phycisphaerales bacterium]|nr:amidohydrolase [Phycisphaerales bacterium]
MDKIDIHTHILPPEWPDLAEQFGGGRWLSMQQRLDASGVCRGASLYCDGNHFRDVQPNCFDHAVRLEEMERTGVRMQALSTVPVMFSYWAEPDQTLYLARLLNDHIAEVCRAFPDRFAGLGTLPMQNPELAIGELERCMNELDMSGIQIGSHIDRGDKPDWNLNEPAVFDVLQAAADLGACVFVHPWDMMGSEQMRRYWLPWLVGMPAETSRAMCSVMFGGVLDRIPHLRICFAHGGGSFPGTIGRIEHGFRVRPDLCAVDCSTNPRDYLARPAPNGGVKPARVYVDSLVHDPAALDRLIDLFGAERIALGSDYPFPLGEAMPGAMIEAMDRLSHETRTQILSLTPSEFLGLRVPLSEG